MNLFDPLNFPLGTAVPGLIDGANWQPVFDSIITKYGGAYWHGPGSGSTLEVTNTALAVGRTLLIDGDMEAGDVSTWNVGFNATLTKETTNPHGGSNVLRIAYTDHDYPFATQTILTSGKTYRARGYARSDGSTIPRAGTGSVTNLWTGTTSTDWQAFDFTFASTSTSFLIQSNYAGTGYAEFDDVSVVQLNIPANDSNMDGSITGATWDAGPAGANALLFDGNNDVVDWYSLELNSLFNPSAGTVFIPFKSNTWAAGTDYLCSLAVDANNRVIVYRDGTDLVVTYSAGGTDESVTIPSGSPSGWGTVGLTWDTGGVGVTAYYNGVQSGTPQAIAGTWVGNLASNAVALGAGNTTPDNVFDGLIGPLLLLRDAATAGDISNLSRGLGV